MDQILKHKIVRMIAAVFPSPYVDAQARRPMEDFEVGKNCGNVLRSMGILSPRYWM